MTTTPANVYITGYHTANDGAFGSNFFKLATDTGQVDNGGTIIRTVNGVYELQYDGAVNVEWFGASSTKTDNQVYIQKAMDSSGKGITIELSPTVTYRTSGTIYFKYGQQRIEGNGGIIDYTGAGAAIDSEYEVANIYPAYTQLLDMTIVVNTIGASGVNVHAQYGKYSNVYVYLRDDNQTGWNLLESQTGVTMVYYSDWVNCGCIGTVGSGGTNQTGWYFQQINQLGPNTNTFSNGNNTGLTLGFSIRGSGNKLYGVCVQGTDTCVLVSNLAGAEGVGCSYNTILDLYLEGGASAIGVDIRAFATDTIVLGGFATGFSGGGLYQDAGIRSFRLANGDVTGRSLDITGSAVVGGDVTISGTLTTSQVTVLKKESLTIAGGAIFPAGSYILVSPEGAGTTDDLAAISGGVDGQIIVLSTETVGDSIQVLSPTSANITLTGNLAFTLDNVLASLTLIKRATFWKINELHNTIFRQPT
jgi:hypothetical protein